MKTILKFAGTVKYFSFVAVLVYSINSYAQVGWQNVGGANFAQSYIELITMTFGPEHSPYVAYNYFDGISVRKYTSGHWSLVGSAHFTDSTTGYISIAVARDTTPYVAFQDEGDSSKASVMKFNGTNWSYVGARGFSHGYYTEISSPVIATDSSGVPYVAYVHSGNPGLISVMKFDGTSWVYVGAPNIYPIGLAEDPFIAFGPNNTPYVAFAGNIAGFSTYKANVMKFDGSAWVFAGASAFSQRGISTISLAFDRTGAPYVAFQEASPNLRLTVMKLTGTTWVAVGPTAFTANYAVTPSIAIDTTGIPYVAFTDYSNNLRTSVMKYTGSWQYVGSPGFSIYYGRKTTLAFDRNIPYVAFYDVGTSNGARVMKFDSVCGPGITGRSVFSSCGTDHSGSINFSAAGTNLTYKIQSGSYTDSNSTGLFSGLSGGYYLETVSDGRCLTYGYYDFVLPRDSAPTVTAGYTSPWCLGSSLHLNASPAGYTYVWSGPNGSFITNQPDTVIANASAADTGIYSIVLIAPDGCTDTNYAHLRITLPVRDTLLQTICQGQTYAGHVSTGTFNDTYTSMAGCDSIRTLHLTVTPEPQSIDSQTICYGQSYDGYSFSGIYHDTYSLSGGCDSMRVLVLNVLPDSKPLITVRGGDTLRVDTSGVINYIWYRNGVVIGGPIANVYVASQDGYYQVEVFRTNSCQSISDSVHIVHTNIIEAQPVDFTFLTISPNIFLVHCSRFIDEYNVYTICGQLVRTQNIQEEETIINMQGVAAGIYVVAIKTDGLSVIRRISVLE